MIAKFTEKELIQKNQETASKWIAECPKCHRLKKYESTVKKYTEGKLVEKEGCAFVLMIGNIHELGHEAWAPVEAPWCAMWQINDEARRIHDQEIHELRHALPHKTVFSDAGCLRVEFDGTEMMFGNVGGDGEHKVWMIDEKIGCERTLLSLNGESSDPFLCSVKAKNVKVYEYDCDGTKTVFEIENETKQEYEVRNVTNGWKIVHIIK